MSSAPIHSGGVESPLRPPEPRRWVAPLIAALLVAAVLLVALLAQTLRRPSAVPAPAAVPAPPPAAASAPSVAGADRPPDEVVLAEPAPGPPPLAAEEVPDALVLLLGRPAVLAHLQSDDFAHRFVATVDNLARPVAPARLWPVNPTAGRFTVDRDRDPMAIDPDNGLRYSPFVLLLESVDAARAVDLYLRMQPLLQAAYVDLGNPDRPFHARLLEVLDHLLAAPNLGAPPAVRPASDAGGRTFYEFVDPDLEAASAGWKLMARIGPVNERRVKAWLAALKRELVSRSPRPEKR